MKTASLLAACAIVVIANAIALTHAARNRAGSPEADVTLTERELQYPFRAPSDDNSGVTLNLAWAGAGNPWPEPDNLYPNWLDESKLRARGFDCRVDSASPAAPRFYQQQQPSRAYVALENGGPAYQAWLAAQRSVQQRPALANRTHLIAIDADLDPARLRVRYPDRTKIIITSAVIALSLSNPRRAPKVEGSIQQAQSSVHVSRPFSDRFTRTGRNPHYRVRLRYGALYEPVVTSVD